MTARTGPPPPAPEPLRGEALDAHCHLDAMGVRLDVPGHDPASLGAAMAAARAVGVVRVVTVGDTVASSAWCVEAAQAHPDVYAAVAVHPTEVAGLSEADYDALAVLAAHGRVVAIGETGLDNHWDLTSPADQEHHFRRHIQLAKDAGKALMIHDREAHDAVLRILREEGPPLAGVVFHAFSGDADMARYCADQGFLLSFPGVVTFRNAPALREAVAAAPLESILVETDAPFLTPHPHRGRPNAPYLIPLTLRVIADIRGLDESELCAAITANAARLFGWDRP
jgi:TatD DNase family protein